MYPQNAIRTYLKILQVNVKVFEQTGNYGVQALNETDQKILRRTDMGSILFNGVTWHDLNPKQSGKISANLVFFDKSEALTIIKTEMSRIVLEYWAYSKAYLEPGIADGALDLCGEIIEKIPESKSYDPDVIDLETLQSRLDAIRRGELIESVMREIDNAPDTPVLDQPPGKDGAMTESVASRLFAEENIEIVEETIPEDEEYVEEPLEEPAPEPDAKSRGSSNDALKAVLAKKKAEESYRKIRKHEGPTDDELEDQARQEAAKEFILEGRKAFQNRKNSAAVAQYRKALEIVDDNATYWAMLAEALMKSDATRPEAYDIIRKAVEMEEQNPAFHTLQGKMFLMDDEKDKAKLAFKKALLWDDSYVNARKYLRDILATETKPPETLWEKRHLIYEEYKRQIWIGALVFAFILILIFLPSFFK